MPSSRVRSEIAIQLATPLVHNFLKDLSIGIQHCWETLRVALPQQQHQVLQLSVSEQVPLPSTGPQHIDSACSACLQSVTCQSRLGNGLHGCTGRSAMHNGSMSVCARLGKVLHAAAVATQEVPASDTADKTQHNIDVHVYANIEYVPEDLILRFEPDASKVTSSNIEIKLKKHFSWSTLYVIDAAAVFV